MLVSLSLANKTALVVLMVVLITFVVLLTVLGIVFITALKKRQPVVKVVMAPPKEENYATMQPALDSSLMQRQSLESSAPMAALGAAVAPQPVPETAATVDSVPEEPAMPRDRMALKYNYTFEAKLIQSDDDVKDRYNEIKNCLFSYKNVKANMSKKRESFRVGREYLARLNLRGRTLCLYLATDPAKYADTKYKLKDVSGVSSTADTPAMLRLTSARRVTHGKELIAEMMAAHAIEQVEHKRENFHVAYKSSEELERRGLAKLVKVKVRPFKKPEAKEQKLNA